MGSEMHVRTSSSLLEPRRPIRGFPPQMPAPSEGAEASVVAARDLTEPVKIWTPSHAGQLEHTRSERHNSMVSAIPVDTSGGGLAAIDCMVTVLECSFPVVKETELRARYCGWLDESTRQCFGRAAWHSENWPESQAHRRSSF